MNDNRFVTKDGRIHKCEYCGKEIGPGKFAEQDLQRHIQSKHGTSEKIECPICKEKFVKIYLKKHIRIVHEGIKDQVHKCEQCGKEYAHKLRLRIHIKRDHDNIRDEECNQCGKLFFCRETLKKHLRNTHNIIAAKTSGSSTNRDKAPDINEDPENSNNAKKEQCNQCGKLVFKSYLKKHIRTVHEGIRDQIYTCEHCGKEYTNNFHLKTHIKQKHEEHSFDDSSDAIKKEQCNQCGKLFFKKYLEKHIRTVHEGKRDQVHKCEHCGKEYVHNLRLRIHIKRDHDNIRDEECDQCGKLFSCTETLKEHTKKVHNKGNQKFFHEKNNFEFANVRDHFTKVNK